MKGGAGPSTAWDIVQNDVEVIVRGRATKCDWRAPEDRNRAMPSDYKHPSASHKHGRQVGHVTRRRRGGARPGSSWRGQGGGLQRRRRCAATATTTPDGPVMMMSTVAAPRTRLQQGSCHLTCDLTSFSHLPPGPGEEARLGRRRAASPSLSVATSLPGNSDTVNQHKTGRHPSFSSVLPSFARCERGTES